MLKNVAVTGVLCVALVRPATSQASIVIVGAADSTAHVFRGDRTAFADAARLVIRDATAWRQLWALLAIGRPDSASPPKVDFRNEILVLAAYGARPYSGIRVVIDTVRRSGVAIEVIVRSVSPDDACLGPLAIIQPVDVVRIPRSERPVAFVERVVQTPCPGK